MIIVMDDIRTQDPEMTLIEWKQLVEELMMRYGEDAIMFIDSGKGNNAQLVIEDE